MNLIIHDLKSEQWDEVKHEYDGWNVVADDGSIRPCIGCFGCWNKDPGQCVVHDGLDNMGALIHEAEEVVVISRYTYGGFSSFVKNVFDRSLSYVLPQFEVIDGETHHQKRYPEDKPFTFIFYGYGLGEREQNLAARYVKAVCTNIRGHVKDLIFREWGEPEEAVAKAEAPAFDSDSRMVILNGSMRSEKGNSALLARELKKQIKEQFETGIDILNLRDYLSDMPGLISRLEDYQVLVLALPLYVDGLPAQVIRLMETFAAQTRSPKIIYVLANMGLYESSQLVNLFSAVKEWSDQMGFAYYGGLGVSCGELVGGLMQALPFRFGPTNRIANAMDCLAEAIVEGTAMEDDIYEKPSFPRSLYISIANNNWNRTAKRNGLKPEDLYRQK